MGGGAKKSFHNFASIFCFFIGTTSLLEANQGCLDLLRSYKKAPQVEPSCQSSVIQAGHTMWRKSVEALAKSSSRARAFSTSSPSSSLGSSLRTLSSAAAPKRADRPDRPDEPSISIKTEIPGLLFVPSQPGLT